MSDRVYVLLDVVKGKSAQVVRALRNKHGVVMADVLEGLDEVMMVAEAPERHRLAELTIKALISVESMTGKVQLLPIKNELGNNIIAGSYPVRHLEKAGRRYSK